MTATSTQDAARKIFVAGLEDIHAIQRDAKAMMLKVIDRLDHYPEARERLKAHLGDKEREMARAEEILSRIGEKPSGAKDSMFSMMGGATAMLTGMADDDILKSSMLTYALAGYEIALYESLLTLAEPAGAPDARPLLEQSLTEERNMAEWLHEHLEPTVMRYVELKGAGQQAAH
jgi:ferritin-like metal-binding protein YciE